MYFIQKLHVAPPPGFGKAKDPWKNVPPGLTNRDPNNRSGPWQNNNCSNPTCVKRKADLAHLQANLGSILDRKDTENNKPEVGCLILILDEISLIILSPDPKRKSVAFALK